MQNLNLKVPIRKIFSKKGRIYTSNDEGFESSEDE